MNNLHRNKTFTLDNFFNDHIFDIYNLKMTSKLNLESLDTFLINQHSSVALNGKRKESIFNISKQTMHASQLFRGLSVKYEKFSHSSVLVFQLFFMTYFLGVGAFL